MAARASQARAIYLCASYCRRLEMRCVAKRLEGMGHRVTSRWIWCKSEAVEFSHRHPICHAADDLEDIRAADTLVYFPRRGGRGGKDAEWGFSLSRPMDRYVVGERVHIFHWYGTAVKDKAELYGVFGGAQPPVVRGKP